MTDHDALAALLSAFGVRLAAAGYGWEAIITREGPTGEETVAHLTTANPDAAGVRVTGDAGLREALDRIRDITKPLSMTMQGPRWMSGDGDIFGGGNREKVWRIADAALTGDTPEADR